MSSTGLRRAGAGVLVLLLPVLTLLAPPGSWTGVLSGLALATLAVLGAGLFVLRVLPPVESVSVRLSLAILLGWGLLGTVLAFLGFAALLSRAVVAMLLTVLALPAIPLLLSETRGRWRDRKFWPASVWVAILALILLGILTSAAALRPPSTETALVHSASLPRQWAMSGEVWARIGMHSSFRPSLHLVWRTAGGVLGGPRLDALLGLVEVALVALGTAVAVRSVLGKGWAAALLAATFVVSLPLLGLVTAERSGGPAAAGLAAGTLWALLRSSDAEDALAFSRSWAAVAGLLLGFALCCGWSALPIAAAVLLVGLVRRPQGEGVAGMTARLALVGFLAFVPLTPWLARAAFLTGNPFYPHLFGGAGWDGTVEPELPLVGLDLLGWVTGAPAALAVVGPLLLLLVPLAIASPLLGERAGPLALAAGVLGAGWGLCGGGIGWTLPTLVLVVALGSTGAARLRRRLPAPGKVVLGLLLTFTFVQAVPLWISMEANRFGLFADSRVVESARNPELAWLRDASRASPTDARILLVGETHAWPLERPAIWGTRSDVAPVTLLLREASATNATQPDLAFRAALRKIGITHFLVSPRGALELDQQGHFREQGNQKWAVVFRYLVDPRQSWGDPETGNALWAVRTEAVP